MTIRVDIQRASTHEGIPENRQLRHWVRKSLSGHESDCEMTIRIVDTEEASQLNEKWRKKKGATNVLSFPFDGDNQLVPALLGDIVICAPVISREATEQRKTPEAHWAHMVIHGTLHLLGYDHRKKGETQVMEDLETRLLESLGYKNPYLTHQPI